MYALVIIVFVHFFSCYFQCLPMLENYMSLAAMSECWFYNEQAVLDRQYHTIKKIKRKTWMHTNSFPFLWDAIFGCFDIIVSLYCALAAIAKQKKKFHSLKVIGRNCNILVHFYTFSAVFSSTVTFQRFIENRKLVN